MIQAPRNKYLETSVQTAAPATLLIMLVDGAIRFCRAGIENLRQNNFEEANNQLVKVQSIISEFVITLDRSSPIADSLLQLYEYFNYQLIQANIKKSTAPAEEVLQHLIELRETWFQASKLAAAPQTEFSHG